MNDDKKHLLPIQYSEEGGWSLASEDLNNHLKAHFDDLRQHALAGRDISKKRIGIVAILVLGMAIAISVLAITGATLWAFFLALFSLMEVKPLLAFAEKDANIKAIEGVHVSGSASDLVTRQPETAWKRFKEKE